MVGQHVELFTQRRKGGGGGGGNDRKSREKRYMCKCTKDVRALTHTSFLLISSHSLSLSLSLSLSFPPHYQLSPCMVYTNKHKSTEHTTHTLTLNMSTGRSLPSLMSLFIDMNCSTVGCKQKGKDNITIIYIILFFPLSLFLSLSVSLSLSLSLSLSHLVFDVWVMKTCI